MLCQTVLSSLALIASAAAISVNTPTGWTTTGPNTISWSSVDTDKTTFAMILTNLDTQFLSTPITLVANETTDAGSVTLSLDSALPSGSGFRVNFVANLDQESTIYAQSSNFSITAGTSSSSSGSKSSTSSSSGSSGSSAATSTVTVSATSGASGSASGSDASSSASASASAAASAGNRAQVGSGLVGIALAAFAVLA